MLNIAMGATDVTNCGGLSCCTSAITAVYPLERVPILSDACSEIPGLLQRRTVTSTRLAPGSATDVHLMLLLDPGSVYEKFL